MSNISEIGTRIKVLREQKGLTQKELGKLIDCPQTTVANWEGRAKRFPRKEMLTILANALDVSESYLLGIERKNSFKITHLGNLEHNMISKSKQDYLEVTEIEYKANRFSITMKENKFPLLMENDYCIFEKNEPEVNDIVLVKIKEEYFLKRWKNSNGFIILVDISINELDEPIIFEKNRGVKLQGKLIAIKRYLK